MNSLKTARSGILAGGNFITDYVKMIDAWPEQDTLASIRSESMCNGGGPYNILKDLALLAPDLPREACGLIGEDLNGDWILKDCELANINTTQLHRTNAASTSYTDAMTVAPTGRRTFFHQRGANALLEPEHFDFEGTDAKIFMLGYLMLLNRLDEIDADGQTGSAKVLQAARAAGLITAVDCVSEPNPKFPDVVLSALGETDILFLNEFEIGQIIREEVPVERNAMVDAAQKLASECHLKTTQIVLHSVAGAVVARADGSVFSHPSVKIPVDQIAGSSGAGDAFAAGYLLGIHNDQEIEVCLSQAVCVAAQSLTDPTPSGGMTTLEECLANGDRFGFSEF